MSEQKQAESVGYAKTQKSLAKNLLASILVMAAAICFFSMVTGFMQYSQTIKQLYNDIGYTVAELTLEEIDRDKVAAYAATWEKDAYYDEMVEYLKEVETSSGAAYIYIVVPNEDQTMTYIYDSSGMDFGSQDPISAHFDEVMGVYKTGERADNYFVRHSAKYGYLTSSIVPVKDSAGNVVALLFVDVYMELITSTLYKYVGVSVITSLVIVLIFCVVYFKYMKFRVIDPINVICNEANNFIDNGVSYSEKLGQIKTEDEMELLATSIKTMEGDIVRYIDNLQTVTKEKERIGAELDVAKKIQADMLPTIFPPYPDRNDFDIFASMDPAKEVGGDFYDFFMIDDSHLGMVMADVSGKGVPAALFMVISKTLIKNSAMSIASPKEVLEKVNNQLCENNAAEMFVTVWLGVLDLNTGHVVSANAGHEYPALRTARGDYQLINDPHGFVCAGMENLKYKEFEFDIEPGGALFLYTDGVAEATSIDNELFGTERMLNALNSIKNLPIEETLPIVRRSIDDFVGEAEQFDDITMMVIRYKGHQD